MNFLHYQQEAHTTAVYSEEEALSYLMCGLSAEVGEVLGKYAKYLRKDKDFLDRESLKDELGDVLWFVSELCTELEVSLDDVARDNLAKLASRRERGVLKGSGDKR
jgi:NTP pyrophosphatase (non-canonical NTP hydrolase)